MTNLIDSEKFQKHYLQVVKTVTEQGENIKRLNSITMELQVEVAKLKEEKLTANMTVGKFLFKQGEKTQFHMSEIYKNSNRHNRRAIKAWQRKNQR